MPGRGTPWRGVGKGKQDRIGSGEIKDDSLLSEDIKDLTITDADIANGTISEAKLDSGVVVKLNSAGGHTIQDEGTPISQQTNLNFKGAGVTAVFGAEDTTTVTIPAGTGHGIQDEGTPLVQRANLNFKGAGVVASDGIEDTTDITIAGGGALLREDIGSPNDDFWFYDEFFYPNPTAHYPHLESLGTLGVPNPAIGGQVSFTSGAVANNLTRTNTCGAGLAVIDGTKKVIVRWREKMEIADINTAFVNGLTPNSNEPRGTFPYSIKNSPIAIFLWDGTGNVDTYSDDGVSVEQTDTGVAGDTAFHTYEIEFDPAGTPTLTWKIDGSIVKTQTTNLPSGQFAIFSGAQTGTSSSRTKTIDSLFIFNER